MENKKLKIELLYDPEIPLLGIYLKKIKTVTQKDICTFFGAIYSSQDYWMDKEKYIYIHIYNIYTYIFVIQS